MGTDYCQLPGAGEYGAVYGECGRRSAEYGEYIDTGLSPACSAGALCTVLSEQCTGTMLSEQKTPRRRRKNWSFAVQINLF